MRVMATVAPQTPQRHSLPVQLLQQLLELRFRRPILPPIAVIGGGKSRLILRSRKYFRALVPGHWQGVRGDSADDFVLRPAVIFSRT